ncbi:hypothetical protein KIN20_035715 [Parelaphostrongylus tenuis]|uniref:Uncharacterized protein n=1 Tax=Parelaphostrongylus tenuis TaxID=148309 RepID=A0AAD5WJX3_PARTN|nr:hypothetical protein KIN20_035715 [Parelaphostrongylus tenuis]
MVTKSRCINLMNGGIQVRQTKKKPSTKGERRCSLAHIPNDELMCSRYTIMQIMPSYEGRVHSAGFVTMLLFRTHSPEERYTDLAPIDLLRDGRTPCTPTSHIRSDSSMNCIAIIPSFQPRNSICERTPMKTTISTPVTSPTSLMSSLIVLSGKAFNLYSPND